MTTKPIIQREQARRDLEQAVDCYTNEASEPVALGLIDALERFRLWRIRSSLN
jgi:hypothetical protein